MFKKIFKKNTEVKQNSGSQKSKKSDSTRPKGVPAEAIWNASNNEWELGSKNEDGGNIGEWKWWLAPNGHLVCHTFFNNDGEMLSYTRYHPDGTFSQKGTYIGGEKHGTFEYQKSVNESSESSFPPQAPENVFKMIYVYDEGEIDMSQNQLFDFKGNELDQYGNLINPIPKGDVPTDAIWNEEYQEWEKGEFKDENRDGNWKSWNTEGVLSNEMNYENNRRTEEKYYFPNGEISYLVKYNNFGAYKYRFIQESEEYENQHFPSGQTNEKIITLEYNYNNRGYMTNWKGLDANGNVIEENEMYHNLDNRFPQTKFETLEEASIIWNTKGKTFYKEMSRWLGQYYDENSDVDENEPEPVDERSDMERVVLGAIEKFNEVGTPEKARELFMPSYEPISEYVWNNLGKPVQKVVAIDENNLIVKVNHKVYFISDNKISNQDELNNFGVSKDKKYYAKCYNDKIEVTEGWSGGVISTHTYPTSYGDEMKAIYPALTTDSFANVKHLKIEDVKVFANGQKVLLITAEGVYVLSESEPKLLYPQHDKMIALISNFSEKTGGELEKYLFSINMEYVNADISIDDKFIVIGGKMPSPIYAGTCIYKNSDNSFELVKYAEQDSMFSIQNQFHSNGKDMLHGACMYASIGTNWSKDISNTTFRMNVADIDNGALELDNFAGGYRQAPGVVSSVSPYDEDSFALGMSDDGYIWVNNSDSSLKGYLFVGGRIVAMDKTLDGKYLFVATNQGQVIKFEIGTEKGENLITNLNIVDQKRFLFFNGYEPLVW
ncbi:MAG: hypothetical protein L3J08_07770 [Flavobacteriaceae bacterium]|nr:hypothetical protein [Flavobacteriaceae bacterium]